MGGARPDSVVARRRVPGRRRARVRGPGRAAEARPGTEPVGGRRAGGDRNRADGVQPYAYDSLGDVARRGKRARRK